MEANMKQTSFPMKPDGRLTVRCGADLSVEGIEAATMVVIVENGAGLRMKEETGVFSLSADSDCRVILPYGVTVTVEKVGGDASIKNLSRRLIVGKVGGDLHVQQLEGASIETVSGDCLLYGAAGSVEINRVGGDLLAEISGSLIVNNVGGDARMQVGAGAVQVTAGGDIALKFLDEKLPETRASAGGDISLLVPATASGLLEMSAGGEEISVHVGGQDYEYDAHEASLPLGEGGATLKLSAGDEIEVSDHEDEDWDFNEDMESMDQHWEDFGIEIEEKIREGLKSVSETVRAATENAARAGHMAEEKVNRAMHRLEERGINAGRKRKVVGFTFGNVDLPEPAKPAGASNEERMIVLRMLQEKKISIEEAEKLLNALDR
jgi:hypothetical protein